MTPPNGIPISGDNTVMIQVIDEDENFHGWNRVPKKSDSSMSCWRNL